MLTIKHYKMCRKTFSALLFTLFLGSTIFFGHTYTSKPTKNAIISGILHYPMDTITKRCQKDFNYTDEDMVILERELKRYLILCALKEQSNTAIAMYSHDVDNLWHSFILFTREYAAFGTKYAGHFMHHVPETGEQSPSQENAEAFCAFIKNYETTFNVEADPIWFLDMVEKSQEISTESI